jgi:hypothetical protein
MGGPRPNPQGAVATSRSERARRFAAGPETWVALQTTRAGDIVSFARSFRAPPTPSGDVSTSETWPHPKGATPSSRTASVSSSCVPPPGFVPRRARPDRTGHDGHSMIERYRRKARTWNLGQLGPLHELIPELAVTEHPPRIRPGLALRFTARVAKLADAADLGSAAARRRGSTPLPCTFEGLACDAKVWPRVIRPRRVVDAPAADPGARDSKPRRRDLGDGRQGRAIRALGAGLPSMYTDGAISK